MTSLLNHQAAEVTKLLYIGDSSTGKTGSLTSLVKAGYKLRILDMDNGLDVLRAFVGRDCPENMGNVEYESPRDKYSGTKVSGTPKAFAASLTLLNKWPDGTEPKDWGKDYILVIDSLTGLGKAAHSWAEGMNPLAKEPRTWYFAAQQAIENVIAQLTSKEFHCNVIVITHVNFKELPDGTIKGWPSSIGSALGPTLPKYFNSLILAESSGSGDNVKRWIKTAPTGIIDLKNPVPFKIDSKLPLETGLSTLFATLKEPN